MGYDQLLKLNKVVYYSCFVFYKPLVLNFSCLGLPKVQLPTAFKINNNAHAPQANGSYIDI